MSRRRSRSRPRRDGDGTARLLWVGCCVAVLLAVVVIAPSTSYSVAEFDRQSGVDVVPDDAAILGLQTAASLEEGQDGRIVTVVNNFGQIELRVTVALTPPSRSEGSLVVDGSDRGDSYQFTVQPGGQGDIGACFTADGTGVPANATFNATFTGTGTDLSGTIDQRTVPIVDDVNESVNC